MSAVTCVYIDNTDNDQIFELLINVTSQRIIAQPGSQGYYAVIVPSTFQFIATSPSSSAIVPLYILNYTPSNSVWGPSSATPPGTQDVNIVSSITLDVDVQNFPATQDVRIVSPSTFPVSGVVAVSNFPATQPVSGTVAVSNFPATQDVNITGGLTTLENNDTPKPFFQPSKRFSNSYTTTGSHPVLIGSNFYILSGFSIIISPDTTNTFPTFFLNLTDSIDGGIANYAVGVPASTPVGEFLVGNLLLTCEPGFFYHSTSSGSVLSFSITNFGSGSFNITINLTYMKTNIQGA